MPRGTKINRERVRELHTLQYTDAMIAEALGVTRFAIQEIRANELSLPTWGMRSPHARRRSRKAQKVYFQKHLGITSIFEIAHLSKRIRAAQMGWPGVHPAEALVLNALEDGPVRSNREVHRRCNERKRRDKPYGYGPTISLQRCAGLMMQLRRRGLVRTTFVSRVGKGRGGREGIFSLTPEALLILARRTKRTCPKVRAV